MIIPENNGFSSSDSTDRSGNGSDDLRNYLDCLTTGKEKGKYVCPACQGNNLSVNLATGKFNCFNGCSPKEVFIATKKLSGKWENNNNKSEKTIRPRKAQEYIYWIKDANFPGVKVSRYDDGQGNKKFYQSRYQDGKWVTGLTGVKRENIAPYGYQWIRQVSDRDFPLFIVEGESCVTALRELGFFAVCNLGGSGKWLKSHSKLLKGFKDVILCPDMDIPGLKHMEAIYKDFPNAKFLYAFPSHPHWKKLPDNHGLDIADWIQEGATKQQILDAIEDKKKSIYISDNLVYTRENQINKQEDEDKPIRLHNKKLIKFIKSIYEDRLGYNFLDLEPYLDGKPFKDAACDVELTYLHLAEHYGLEVTKDKAIDCLLSVAKENSFHPVEKYLGQVSTEIEPANIDRLASLYFGTHNELYDWYLKTFLMASVARILYPGCQLKNVLILQGDQDIGKSSFFRILGGEFFTDSMGDARDKEQLQLLHRGWIHEVGEFETIYSKKEIGEIKRFVAKTDDLFRPPYARSTVKFLRRFVFCGTCNEATFLKDPTGNVRFWVIPIGKKILLESLEKDKDAIWSGAVHELLKADEKNIMNGKLWQLPEHLIQANKQNTTQFEQEDEWQFVIESVIEAWGDAGFILYNKIWDELGIEDSTLKRRNGKVISDIMTKLGWKQGKVRKIDGKAQKVWIPKDTIE